MSELTSAPAPGPHASLDTKTFAIGVLSITACVLFVGWLLVTLTPTPALATGQLDRGGDYIMVTQQLSNSQEGVIIIDAASQRMSLYAMDINQKTIRTLQLNVPLDRLPGGGPPP